MQNFLEFLYNLLITFWTLFQDFHKTVFSNFFKISSDFYNTIFLSKVNLKFPHNYFSLKSSYFTRSFSQFTRKVHQVSIKIFLKCVRRVPKIFSTIFLSGYFLYFPKLKKYLVSIFNVINSPNGKKYPIMLKRYYDSFRYW